MLTRKLQELYNVDTISQDKGWKKVNDALGVVDEDTLIDFTNINVVDPWKCNEFKKLLRNKHIHMKFMNNKYVSDRIKMMCIIEGLDDSRIDNEEILIPKAKTPDERKIEKYGSELISYFKVKDNVAILDLSKKYSQIQSSNTMLYVDYAIRELHKKGIDKFILDFNNLVVLHSALQLTANLMVQYNSEGFSLIVDCKDEYTRNELSLCIHNATSVKYDDDQRKVFIENTIKKNTPGILIKYKKSKALDDFGREGKGEVVSSRIAIFKDLKTNENGQDVAVIHSFNNKYFYTALHWMIEHDNEEPEKLIYDELEIPLSELGICDTFLGSKYHFLLPIQRNEEESKIVIYDIDSNGNNVKKKCTIPERMKIVFDSWNIEYDKESLDNSIKLTNEFLSKNNKKDTQYITSY